MPLTDLAARKAKPKDRDYKLAVERGMYLYVKTNGAKYWRMKYRFAGKEKTLSFGVYPEVSLTVQHSNIEENISHGDLIVNEGGEFVFRKCYHRIGMAVSDSSDPDYFRKRFPKNKMEAMVNDLAKSDAVNIDLE